ncbi:Phosphatidylinositol 4,5-bisphosphate 3-kinase catalytic subunit gamma isoform [Balamuthia mandrillaris]
MQKKQQQQTSPPNRKRDSNYVVAQRLQHQYQLPDFVLLHKIVNESFEEADLQYCSDKQLYDYLPLLVRIPFASRLRFALLGRVETSPLLQRLCFWLRRADCAPPNFFSWSSSSSQDKATKEDDEGEDEGEEGEEWLWEDDQPLRNTAEFFAKCLASEGSGPGTAVEGQAWAGLDLADPLFGSDVPVVHVQVTKVFASGHRPCLLSLRYGDAARAQAQAEDIRGSAMLYKAMAVGSQRLLEKERAALLSSAPQQEETPQREEEEQEQEESEGEEAEEVGGEGGITPRNSSEVVGDGVVASRRKRIASFFSRNASTEMDTINNSNSSNNNNKDGILTRLFATKERFTWVKEHSTKQQQQPQSPRRAEEKKMSSPSSSSPSVELRTNNKLVVEKAEDLIGAVQKIVFKNDDIRSDMMVELMLGVFNLLWQSSGLEKKLHAVTFHVCPIAPGAGFMQFMENSVPLREWKWDVIDSFSAADMEQFITTAAGGFVAGYLLGIRDRHQDNMMIQNDTTFFHLDFKHAFNRKTRGIDACHFAIPKFLKAKLEEKGQWDNFKHRCADGFIILRRNNGMLIHLAQLLFSTLFHNDEIERCFIESFFLQRTEAQARELIHKEIEHGVTSVRTGMKNMVHTWSIKDKTAKLQGASNSNNNAVSPPLSPTSASASSASDAPTSPTASTSSE